MRTLKGELLLYHLVTLCFPKKYASSDIIILLSPERGLLERDCRVIEIRLRVFEVMMGFFVPFM